MVSTSQLTHVAGMNVHRKKEFHLQVGLSKILYMIKSESLWYKCSVYARPRELLQSACASLGNAHYI